MASLLHQLQRTKKCLLGSRRIIGVPPWLADDECRFIRVWDKFTTKQHDRVDRFPVL